MEAPITPTLSGMDDLTNDELLAEAIADETLNVLTRLDGEARGEFLQAFMPLAVQHRGAATAELLRPDRTDAESLSGRPAVTGAALQR